MAALGDGGEAQGGLIASGRFEPKPAPRSHDGSNAMTTDPAQAIVDLIERGSLAQAAYVAAELRLADHLAAGPMQANELARATNCHPPSLHRLLRALVTLEICIEEHDGAFTLGRSGSLLRSDNADSLQSRLLWFGRNQWAVWGQLLQTVRTGESARKRMTGSDGFGMLELDPSAASTFNTNMVQRTRRVAKEVARHYDFSGVGTIADVGGGHGVLLETVLRANPGVRGVLVDRPHAIAGAPALLDQAGVADRCELVPGDFFASLPAGAEVYLLKNIVHDWDDERALRILRNCHVAMPDGGRLLLIEHVLPARLDASASHRAIAHADLAMMLGPGGKERNEHEFQELLRCAGLALADVKPIGLGYSILEARKAPSSGRNGH
jgi:AraC-like DNA-binding protein